MAQIRPVRAAKSAHIRAHDVYAMAVRLLAKHGPAARDIAAFSEAEHDIRGDFQRRAAWRAVESTVSDMLSRRLPTSGITIH